MAFNEFRKQFCLVNTWPIPVEDICKFIAHSFESNLSQSTIKCHLAGISFICKLNDLPDPTQKFVVKKMLEGVGRVRGKKSDARLPITHEILVSITKILPYVCNSSYETKLFLAAFSIAYHGLFRIGEMAISAKESDHIVQIENVSLESNNLKFRIPSSKTDQFKKGCEINIRAEANKSICPVALWQDYSKVRPKIVGPAFCHYNGSPITRYQFVAVLKKSLLRAGIDCKCYSSHSFRIGRASTLSMEGVPDNIIRSLGRWKSEAYRTYIRPQN